ncbi:S8 family serine peptidase [Auraticoccus cholistanensis]|uniref:S8 family serine peptidase n=1 Tax=Auraticoccus cholistanensis TaxID=2656650 RepID=UPI0012E8C1D7
MPIPVPASGDRPGRRRTVRAGTAALALGSALGLLSPAALPAGAVGDGEVFDSSECQNFQATPAVDSWAAQRLGLDEAAELATGRGVRIAVIDTGADTEVPALDGADVSVVNYTGFEATVEPGTDLRDCRHGTQVTSLIVGQPGAEGTDFTGVAPEASVVVMRSLERGPALPQDGQPPQQQQREPIAPVVEAVRAATAEGVDIINISQTSSYDPDYEDAVADAIAAGIVVVAAAGNGQPGAPTPYPAAWPGVIAVGATTRTDAPAAFSQSSEGLQVTVSAPGEQVLTASPSQHGEVSWATVEGTSFAAPQVSGVVALLLEREPDLTPAQVARRLRRTADPIPRSVPDAQAGWGVVNPVAALTEVVGAQTPAPGPVASPTPAEDYRDRPPPDHRARDRALLLAGGAVVLVVAAAVVAASLPAGRRRGWTPSRGDRPDPR